MSDNNNPHLKALVGEYVEKSKKIEVMSAMISDLRKRVKELQPEIISAMHQAGQDLWDIPGQGEIEIKTRTKRGGLSKKFLETQLPSVLKVSIDQAKETTAQLLENRPSELVEELKFKMDAQAKNSVLNVRPT